jgi:anti-anti-sigma factor
MVISSLATDAAMTTPPPDSGVEATIVRVHPRVAMVTAAGEVDLSNADELAHLLDDAMAAQADGWVLLDLNEVTFLAARGLDVLAAAHCEAPHHRGGELVVLLDPAAPAARCLRFLPPQASPVVYPTLDAALAALAALADRSAS